MPADRATRAGRRADDRQPRSAHGMVQYSRLQTAGKGRLRKHSEERHSEAGRVQLEPGGVQEFRGGRPTIAAAPLRGVQRAQRRGVPGHRSDGTVRRGGQPNQPELRHRDRHREPDAAAAGDPVIGEVLVLDGIEPCRVLFSVEPCRVLIGMERK